MRRCGKSEVRQEASSGAYRGLTWGVSLKSGDHPESLSLRRDGTSNKANSRVLSMCRTLVSQPFTSNNYFSLHNSPIMWYY